MGRSEEIQFLDEELCDLEGQIRKGITGLSEKKMNADTRADTIAHLNDRISRCRQVLKWNYTLVVLFVCVCCLLVALDVCVDLGDMERNVNGLSTVFYFIGRFGGGLTIDTGVQFL